MIVAVEGASDDLSVALAEPDGRIIGESGWRSQRRQSAELLPRLLRLLDSHGRRLSATSAVAVGIGPGSFTGLRVAMSLAKGISFALHVPIVGVPSLEAWLAAEPSAIAAVGRAGAHEAYLLVRGDEAPPRVVDHDALPEAVRDAPIVAPTELAMALGLGSALAPTRAAGAMGRIATRRLGDSPVGDDLARLEPRYLRAPRGIEAASEDDVRWL